MDRERLRELLREVRSGAVDPETAVERLAHMPFVDVSGARVDTHRALRAGLPEVIYAPGKQAHQIAEISGVLRRAGQDVLVTRVEPALAQAVAEHAPGGAYDAEARLLWFGPAEVRRPSPSQRSRRDEVGVAGMTVPRSYYLTR